MNIGKWDVGDDKRGTWRKRNNHVWLDCPECGQTFTLTGCTIGNNGYVVPHVACPYKCGFEGLLTLDSWRPTESHEEPSKGG